MHIQEQPTKWSDVTCGFQTWVSMINKKQEKNIKSLGECINHVSTVKG